MRASIAAGLRSAIGNLKLVWLLWAWYGLLAFIPAMPAWSWWNGALGRSPEASALLKRFDIGVLRDVIAGKGINGVGLLTGAAAAAGVIALLSSAFAFGGVLEVFGSSDDRRSFMHRFFRGGGHFFWRFFRLAIMAGVCTVLAVGIVAGPIARSLAEIANTEWEPGGYLFGLGVALVVTFIAGFFMLALDYARIRVSRDDSTSMLKAYLSGLRFVLRRAPAAYGLAVAFLLLELAFVLGYVAYETNAPAAGTWGAIAVLLLVQQIVVFGRVFFRVAMVGAERHLHIAALPAPAPVVRSPSEASTSAETPAAEPPPLEGIVSQRV